MGDGITLQSVSAVLCSLKISELTLLAFYQEELECADIAIESFCFQPSNTIRRTPNEYLSNFSCQPDRRWIV
jgi:hypothetical protein